MKSLKLSPMFSILIFFYLSFILFNISSMYGKQTVPR
jgi:hypothetical protein